MPDKYWLSRGSHATPAEGHCAMEFVAYLAGEEHSDSPKCVDPVLHRFGIGLNDALPDDERQRLRPYLARMIGTADDGLTEQRMFMVADWAVRVAAPIGLEAAGRGESAERLRGLTPVVDGASAACAAHAAVAAAAAGAAAGAAANAAAYAADAADAAAVAVAAAPRATIRVGGWERVLPSALDLLDRMLPGELVVFPPDRQRVAAELCSI